MFTQTASRSLAILALLSCAPAQKKENWTGSAHVILGESMKGTETQISLDENGEILCKETYALEGSPPTGIGLEDCEDCAFTFTLQVSDVQAEDGRWCGRFGRDGDETVRLGYDLEVNLMEFYTEYAYNTYYGSSGYWEDVPDASASWTGDDAEGDLIWNWNWTERVYHSYSQSSYDDLGPTGAP